MKRIFKYTLAMSIGLTAIIPSTAFARDTDYTNGASFDWSPYDWTAWSYTFSGSGYRDIRGAFEGVKFDQDAADEINNIYYLTFEINNTSDNLPHSGWYISTLPDVGFDRDDDNGNGYSEEAEAYISASISKEYIDADYSYAFQTGWRNTSSSSVSGNFDYIVQRSIKNVITGEMETYHYDKLDNKSWSVSGVSTSSAAPILSTSRTSSNTKQPEEEKYKNILTEPTFRISQDGETDNFSVFQAIKTKEDFEAYKTKQTEWANKIKKSNVEAVITFNQPIEESVLDELIKAYQLKVNSFEIKAVDSKGTWTTIQGEPGEELIPKSILKSFLSENELNYVGVTSIQTEIGEFDSQKLKQLQSDANIFLVDISKEYVKYITNNQNAKVRVPDLAWKVDKLK